MSKLTGQGLAKFAKSKLGTPYVYGAKGGYGKLTQAHLNSLILAYPNVFTNIYITKARKFVGKICTDCSGLPAWYTGKNIGSYQLYKSASERHPISTIAQAPIGAILWKSGHVGVYIGGGYCVEAKGIDYGIVESKVAKTKFTHWLLFDCIDYDMPVVSQKVQNPYKEPTMIIYQGMTGEGVKWVQWELCEAGFEIDIDGVCGTATVTAIKGFQQSCKIVVDGKVGAVTRQALKVN
jgi:Putative peptidoglycan-binding domain-containing protein